MKEPIEIPLSKTKILLLELLSIGFVIASSWMILSADTQTRYHPYVLKIVGIAGVLFFGITSIYGFIKLFDQKPGMVISHEGLYDNTGALSIGLIMWEDITSFRRVEIASTKLLMVNVSNPDYYIGLGKSAWKRRLMSANNNSYGSPISISSNSLKINFKKLETLLQEHWKQNTQMH